MLEAQIQDRVYFTYTCLKTGNLICNKFSDIFGYSPFTKGFTALFNCNQNKVSEKQVNLLYNAMDLYIQCANCEGFGIPVIEAAACNTKVLSMKHSAMEEVCLNCGGDLLDMRSNPTCHQMHSRRGVIDEDKLAEYMVNFKKEKINTRSKVLEKYTWEKCINSWEKLLDKIEIKDNWDDDKRVCEPEQVSGKVTPIDALDKITSSFPVTILLVD